MTVLSFFSFLFVILSFYKGYHWLTCFEYMFLTLGLYFKLKISFTIFLSLKVFMSFVIFTFEIIYYSNNIKKLQELTSFLSDNKSSSHATSDIVNIANDYSTTQKRMFFFSCCGFSIPFINEHDLKERLDSCGKCQQDWVTVSIYLLSCHIYLSYSCGIIIFRWVPWIVFGLFLFVKFFEFVLLNPLQQILEILLLESIESSLRKDLTIHIILMISSLQIYFHVAFNLFHMGLVAFDILNLKEERLEDNEEAVRKFFIIHGFWFDFVKLILLIVLTHCWHLYVPLMALQFDYFIYLLICLIVGQLVPIVVSQGAKKRID